MLQESEDTDEGSNAHDGDSDAEGEAMDGEDAHTPSKPIEYLKRFTHDLAIVKSMKGYATNSELEKCVSDMVSTVEKASTDDERGSIAILELMDAKLSASQCKKLIPVVAIAGRSFRHFTSYLNKFLFAREHGKLVELRECAVATDKLYISAIKVLYYRRYMTRGGRLDRNHMGNDVAQLMMQKARAEAQPSTGGGLFARLLRS